MQLPKPRRGAWAGLVLACFFIAAGPAVGKAIDPVALQVQLEQLQKNQQTTMDELKVQNKELQERLKAQETALLETQRKSIDWWFSLLGAMVGALAVMFGALPLLLTRQQKADIEKELTSAKDLVASIRGHEQKARDATEKLDSYVSGQPQSAAQSVEINREIAAVQSSPTASETDRLRARAIQASQVVEPTVAQALIAFDLWKALSLLVPQDASAHFNAGYWAQQLYKMDAKPGKTHWLDMLAFFYEQALQIKPDKHEAAYNWGTALGKEAKALVAQDLPAARELWRRAGEKYALALQIKPDKHVAFYNWGAALSAEAKAIKQLNPSEARDLWGRAVEKYQQSLQIERANNKAIYNLACVYSLQGKAADAVSQLEIARQAEQLSISWRDDPDLNPIRTSAEYETWVAKHFPKP